MYNLLVVDDEPIILESLSRMLQKEFQQHFFVYKAPSAALALETFQNHRIDMLITDICMPGMDGFQLLSIIEEMWPDCIAVFLTGQTEFEYAQKAVHTKALEFVLKMDGDEAIGEAVYRGYMKLEQLYEEKRRLIELQDRMREVLPLLKRDCVRELIFTEKWDEIKRRRFIEKMALINDKFVCAQDFLLTAVFFEPKNDLLIENDILKTMESVLTPAFQTVSSFAAMNTGIILAQDNENKPARLKGFLEIARTVCEKSGKYTPQICVYDGAVSLEKAADIFSILQYCKFEIDDAEGIQLYREEKFSHYTWNEGSGIVGVIDTEKLEQCLEYASSEDFFTLLNEIKNKYRKSAWFTEASVFSVCSSILLKALLNNLPRESDVCKQFDFSKLTNYDIHKGFYDAMNFLEAMADKYFQLRQNVKVDVKGQIVHQVNTFILEHISEELSMVRLGELVGLHPVYLSKIYKEITGILPGKYIMTMRVNEAKRLLMDSRLPVQVIAERTGLNTASYFSHYMKKHTGLTPQEIRNGAQQGVLSGQENETTQKEKEE